MDISNTDMRSLLRAIGVLRPHPELSIHEWNAIRKLKIFAKKQHRRYSKQTSNNYQKKQ